MPERERMSVKRLSLTMLTILSFTDYDKNMEKGEGDNYLPKHV